jgi:hypothetical protein
MVRGFYLALDRDFKAAHARWWRTTAGFAVPYERVMLQPPLSDFHGTWLRGAEERQGGDRGGQSPPVEGGAGGSRPPLNKNANGTVVFVTSSAARKYTVDLEKKKIGWGDPLPRRSAAALTGETFTSGGLTFHETTDGAWIRLADTFTAHTSRPPDDLSPNEKWIDIDLVRQTLVAFEGETPVFATLVSSGKRNVVDKDKDHPTPPGTYRIREKHVTATMDGDVAADGPYSIEDVPWVMYFQGSYALHGAFWHANFGHNMSHGCVNLAPADARTLFNWAEPRLPEGWHGVFASDARPGTRIVIHEDVPDAGK